MVLMPVTLHHTASKEASLLWRMPLPPGRYVAPRSADKTAAPVAQRRRKQPRDMFHVVQRDEAGPV